MRERMRKHTHTQGPVNPPFTRLQGPWSGPLLALEGPPTVVWLVNLLFHLGHLFAVHPEGDQRIGKEQSQGRGGDCARFLTHTVNEAV